MNHDPEIILLHSPFPHYISWCAQFSTNVTKMSVLGIQSFVASTFTILPPWEVMKPGLASLRVRGHVEKEDEWACWGQGCGQSNHLIEGDRHVSEAITAPSAPVICQLAANASVSPAHATVPHGVKKIFPTQTAELWANDWPLLV